MALKSPHTSSFDLPAAVLGLCSTDLNHCGLRDGLLYMFNIKMLSYLRLASTNPVNVCSILKFLSTCSTNVRSLSDHGAQAPAV